jgi:hypothetical protein
MLLLALPLCTKSQTADSIIVIHDTVYYDAGIEPDVTVVLNLPHTPPKPAFITGNDALIYLIQFASGAIEGIHDYAYYHPDAFLRAHPRLDPDWWDNRLSWDNKYHNTWFVRTFAVWVTDANHAGKALVHLANSISIAIAFNDFKNWKNIFKRAAISYAVNRTGFNLFYK